MIKIAVLALQGAFIEHEKMLHLLGVETFEVRKKEDWNQYKDGLMIPGGESTTILKLLRELDLLANIQEDINNGLPDFGTCAGLILLSKEVKGEPKQRISTMNITVCRNAYGRQLGSFYTEKPLKGIEQPVPMTFIRAPYIDSVGEGVDVLAEVDGHIVAAKQGNQLVTAFHPELNDNTAIHAFFINNMVKKA